MTIRAKPSTVPRPTPPRSSTHSVHVPFTVLPVSTDSGVRGLTEPFDLCVRDGLALDQLGKWVAAVKRAVAAQGQRAAAE